MTDFIPEVLFADRRHPKVDKNNFFNLPKSAGVLNVLEGVTIQGADASTLKSLKQLELGDTPLFLGIDPSTNCTGLCISDGNKYISGSILPASRFGARGQLLKTPKFTMGANKVRFLVSNFVELIKPLAHRIKYVVIEGLAYSSMGMSRSILDLASLKGRYETVVMILCPDAKILEVSPNKLKSVSTGNYRAGKEEMIEAAKLLFNIDFLCEDGRKIDDEVDAFFLVKTGQAMVEGREFSKLEWT